MSTVHRFLLTFLFAGIIAAQQPESAVLAVGNGDVAAQLTVTGLPERITGRVSFDAILTEREALVRAFNIAFFGVPQKPLAGDIPIAEPLGVLAFGVIPGEPQRLQFDADQRRIFGTLQMNGDAAFLISLAQPLSEADGEGDLYVPPALPTTVAVDLRIGDSDGALAPTRVTAVIAELKVTTTESSFRQFRVEVIGQPSIGVDLGRFESFDTERRLCIQPVQLERPRNDRDGRGSLTTGAGLAFGQPQADLEWFKADVAFTYRRWITIPARQFWVLKASETKALLQTVDVDDCIEVFFVFAFDPEDLAGGGLTFDGGLASAKVITSDGNAHYGIDKTHLAHELGHVLTLIHPNLLAVKPRMPSSPGTLMCKSGFKRDNPQRNSQENENNAGNYLLTYSLKRRMPPGPDCTDRTDCGPCP